MERPGGDGRGEALDALAGTVEACRRCPRLVEWREEVAREKRAAFRDEEYWGRPVPGFGDPDAWLLVVGLAPAAHGANRTGRIFTGDRSGDWLFRALHRAGLANRPDSVARDDGLRLRGTWVTAAVRCAPPGNRPTPRERRNCRPYLEREMEVLDGVRVIVPLGGFAYRHVMRILRDGDREVPSPMPDFEHGLEVPVGDDLTLVVSYHPSQQNTFTGTLTEEMFASIWSRAVELAPGQPPPDGSRGSGPS